MSVRAVAVLGTGTMGAPMARNLAAAELEVRVWNRTTERAEALEDVAAVAATPAEAVDGADAVVTMLDAEGSLVAVMGGTDGALAAMDDDAVWVQMSTVGIEATELLAGRAGDRGVAFVDAPVLGTEQPAEQGELTVLASGPDDALGRCRPLFEAVGARTVSCGAAGGGTRLKLVLNSWLLALVEGLAETIALAEGLDVDPGTFLSTIEGGPLGPAYAQLKGRAMIDREFPASFALRLARKDAGLVLEAAERAGVRAPVAEAVAGQFDRAIEQGRGDEDMAAAIVASAPEH